MIGCLECHNVHRKDRSGTAGFGIKKEVESYIEDLEIKILLRDF